MNHVIKRSWGTFKTIFFSEKNKTKKKQQQTIEMFFAASGIGLCVHVTEKNIKNISILINT